MRTQRKVVVLVSSAYASLFLGSESHKRLTSRAVFPCLLRTLLLTLPAPLPHYKTLGIGKWRKDTHWSANCPSRHRDVHLAPSVIWPTASRFSHVVYWRTETSGNHFQHASSKIPYSNALVEISQASTSICNCFVPFYAATLCEKTLCFTEFLGNCVTFY